MVELTRDKFLAALAHKFRNKISLDEVFVILSGFEEPAAMDELVGEVLCNLRNGD